MLQSRPAPRAGTPVAVLLAAMLSLVLAACSTAPAPAPPGPPAPPPGSGEPVPGWKLTLPQSGDDGQAQEVDPARISPPWLTSDAPGALTFWAPVNGATTANSEHARTELVADQDFAAGSGPQTLSASVAVAQVPAQGGDVIIGQIHGGNKIKSVAFVMLHYQNGNVNVVVKQQQKGDAAQDVALLSGVPLNARFDYGIRDNGDGSMTFTASYNGQNASGSAQVPTDFRGADVRFQAGAYQQADSANGPAAPTDGARVTFFSLNAGPGNAPSS